MKISGVTRRIERRTSRSKAGRHIPLPLAFPDGTARPGPSRNSPGPGPFLSTRSLEMAGTVLSPVPRRRSFSTLFIPSETKSHFGAARRQVP